MLLYKISILSPRILVYINPLTWASKVPESLFWTILGRIYKSFNLGLPFPGKKNTDIYNFGLLIGFLFWISWNQKFSEENSFSIPWLMMSLSCWTKSAFSFSSFSLSLNFFWISLMYLKAAFKFALGGWISPGSLTLVL